MTIARVLGSCSLCGGDVTTPTTWSGTSPPEPTCRRCGAVAAKPVIPMVRPSVGTPIPHLTRDVLRNGPTSK